MSKVVMTDYDNTLHDSDSKFAVKLDGILGLSGKELWEIYLFKIHRAIVHQRFPEKHDDIKFHCKLIFDYLGKPYDRSIAELIAARYIEALKECFEDPRFFHGTFEFLDRVKEKGYKICLTTGEFATEKAICLENFKLKEYFDHILEESVLGCRKTDPNYYRNAIKLLNLSPKDAVSIGDTLTHDIIPAKAVGIKTIWVNRRGEKIEDENARPDHEVRNLLETLKYL